MASPTCTETFSVWGPWRHTEGTLISLVVLVKSSAWLSKWVQVLQTQHNKAAAGLFHVIVFYCIASWVATELDQSIDHLKVVLRDQDQSTTLQTPAKPSETGVLQEWRQNLDARRLCYSILVRTIGNESVLVSSGSGREKHVKLSADTTSAEAGNNKWRHLCCESRVSKKPK